MSRIKNYFNGLADMVAASSVIAGTAKHRPDIGSNREDILNKFFNGHLPRRLSSSVGGQIIGQNERESGQIDIIISNDIGIRFEQNQKTFCTAECVAGAVTIKSTLNTESLADALRNLSTIPEPSPDLFDFKLLKPGAKFSFLENHPSFFVFAYDGFSGEACIAALNDFYRNENQESSCRYPCEVIVNKKYIVSCIRSDAGMQRNKEAPKYAFRLGVLDDQYRGYPFVKMLNKLSAYADWLNHMDISFHNYFNEGFGFPVVQFDRLRESSLGLYPVGYHYCQKDDSSPVHNSILPQI